MRILNIIVEDNGIGFDEEKKLNGIGLHQINQAINCT